MLIYYWSYVWNMSGTLVTTPVDQLHGVENPPIVP